jgi:hypothetical protein
MTSPSRHRRAVITWAIPILRLEAWTIDYEFSDKPPAWAKLDRPDGNVEYIGHCWHDQQRRRAKIWISPKRCKKQRAVGGAVTPESVLLHELVHVWISDLCLELRSHADCERLASAMEELLYIYWRSTQ